MVKRTTRLEIDVVASDKASKVIRDVAGEVADLEDETATIDVDVSDNTGDELADIRSNLDRLTAEDRVVALKATAAGLEAEVRKAERSLGRLDKFDGDEVQIRIDARDRASRKLDAVQAEMRALDGDTATVKVESRGLDDIRGKFSELSGAGGVAALGKGGLIGGAVIGAGILADEFATAAIQAQALADNTGSSVEDASRLLAVFENSRFEFGDLFDIISNMNSQLRDSPELAEQLNIKLDDGKGGVERFLEVTQKLNTEIDDTGTRAQTATTLFGEEGVRQVGMITATVGDLQTAIDGVGDMRVISPEDVEAARSIKADLTEARDIWQGFRRGAGPVGANLLNSTLRGLLGTTYEDDKARQDRIAQGDFTYRITGGLFGNSGQLPPPLPGLTPAEVQRSIGNLRPGGPITEDMLNRVTIINPPGTPATVVSGTRVYDQRNGVR